MDELKPCPFCGGPATFDIVSMGAGNPRGFVRCKNRCCEMCCVLNRYEAFKAWNNRVSTDVDDDYEPIIRFFRDEE